MKKGQWSDIYGETPISFQMKVEDTLDRLEEAEMKKKYKFSMVLVAAVLAVLLAGTALAMGYSYLMEYFERGQIQPLEGAEELIQTDFGAQETKDEPVQIVVEEAVFDGKTAVVQLLLSPTNPEEHALFNMGIQNYPESVYDVEITDHGNGMESHYVVGRKDGKRIINYSVSLRQADENAAYLFERDAVEADELENGSVRVWLEGKVTEGVANKLELIVSGRYDFMDDLRKNEVYDYHYSKEITLNSPNRTIVAKLTPVGEAGGERFEILSAWLEYNALSGQLIVEYAYQPDLNKEPMGIDFRLYDADGNRIAVDSGEESYLGQRLDGWEIRIATDEVQAFEQFSERMYLEAKVIGEDKTLGRVECQVTEVEAVELQLVGEEILREEMPIGLRMIPQGSTQGEHICLLDGYIYAGRKVEVMFTYNGEQKDIGRIRINYKNMDGSKVGWAIYSVGTFKEDYYMRTDMLDGSGWPIKMVLEFVKDGKVIDSFECELRQVFDDVAE